jgi:hypothetical protein
MVPKEIVFCIHILIGWQFQKYPIRNVSALLGQLQTCNQRGPSVKRDYWLHGAADPVRFIGGQRGQDE